MNEQKKERTSVETGGNLDHRRLVKTATIRTSAIPRQTLESRHGENPPRELRLPARRSHPRRTPQCSPARHPKALARGPETALFGVFRAKTGNQPIRHCKGRRMALRGLHGRTISQLHGASSQVPQRKAQKMSKNRRILTSPPILRAKLTNRAKFDTIKALIIRK